MPGGSQAWWMNVHCSSQQEEYSPGCVCCWLCDQGSSRDWSSGPGFCGLVTLGDPSASLSRLASCRNALPVDRPDTRAGFWLPWSWDPCQVYTSTEEQFCTLPFVKSTLKQWLSRLWQSCLHSPALSSDQSRVADRGRHGTPGSLTMSRCEQGGGRACLWVCRGRRAENILWGPAH